MYSTYRQGGTRLIVSLLKILSEHPSGFFLLLSIIYPCHAIPFHPIYTYDGAVFRKQNYKSDCVNNRCDARNLFFILVVFQLAYLHL